MESGWGPTFVIPQRVVDSYCKAAAEKKVEITRSGYVTTKYPESASEIRHMISASCTPGKPTILVKCTSDPDFSLLVSIQTPVPVVLAGKMKGISDRRHNITDGFVIDPILSSYTDDRIYIRIDNTHDPKFWIALCITWIREF